MIGQGLDEVISYPLVSRMSIEQCQIEGSSLTRIKNPLSLDQEFMRPSLLPSLFAIVALNFNRGQKNLRVFEFGKIYQKQGETYHEEQRLGIFLTGNQLEETWLAKNQKVDFHDLASIVQVIFAKLNIKNYTTENFSNDSFSKGLRILVQKNTEIAQLGFISKAVRNQLGIKKDVLFADIPFEALMNLKQKDITFEELSKFPAVRRDLSLVLKKSISFREVEQIAFKIEKKILQQVNVFDTYEGKPLEDNEKSYSVSFILQDIHQTLTDVVIDKTMNQLMTAYEKELGAIIKGK